MATIWPKLFPDSGKEAMGLTRNHTSKDTKLLHSMVVRTSLATSARLQHPEPGLPQFGLLNFLGFPFVEKAGCSEGRAGDLLESWQVTCASSLKQALPFSRPLRALQQSLQRVCTGTYFYVYIYRERGRERERQRERERETEGEREREIDPQKTETHPCVPSCACVSSCSCASTEILRAKMSAVNGKNFRYL